MSDEKRPYGQDEQPIREPEQAGSFDSLAHALYVSLHNPGPVKEDPTWGIETREIAPNVMGDYLPDGTLVGIEFLDVEYVHTYRVPSRWDRFIPKYRWEDGAPRWVRWVRRHVYDDRMSPWKNVYWKARKKVCWVRGHRWTDWMTPPMCERCLRFGNRVSLNPTAGNPTITQSGDAS